MHKDLNRILCAALIHEGFRARLLQNPATTIAAGYEGFSFSLTQEEQRLVNGIQTTSLEDFAAQVYTGMHPKRLGILVNMPARVPSEPLPMVGFQYLLNEEVLIANTHMT